MKLEVESSSQSPSVSDVEVNRPSSTRQPVQSLGDLSHLKRIRVLHQDCARDAGRSWRTMTRMHESWMSRVIEVIDCSSCFAATCMCFVPT